MLSVYLIFKDIASVLLAFWIEDKCEIQKFFIVHFFPYYSHYSFSTLSSLLFLWMFNIVIFYQHVHVIMYINNLFYFTEDWKVRYPCGIQLIKEHCLLISVPLNFSCILNRYLPKMWLIYRYAIRKKKILFNCYPWVSSEWALLKEQSK